MLPLQAPLLQDAVEGVLSSLEEPFIVKHEVPAGVVGVTRVRYVGAGVPAEAQPYPGVVEGLEKLLDFLQFYTADEHFIRHNKRGTLYSQYSDLFLTHKTLLTFYSHLLLLTRHKIHVK